MIDNKSSLPKALEANPSYLRLSGSRTRTIIVGDIHGCIEEFEALLSAVSLRQDDLLLCVGDIIDRGPDSVAVAKFFRDTPNAYCALGNHERRLARVVRGTARSAWSQLHTLSKMSEDERADWAEYFETLPAVIETPHVIVTHARLDPSARLWQQDPYHTCAVGGHRVMIERDENDVPTWFYSFPSAKPICIGHLAYERVELVPGALFALDTRAVYGCHLSALILPEGKIMQVRAKRNHLSVIKGAWRKEKRLRERQEKTSQQAQ